MPFKIRKVPKKELYWVVNTANGRKFSNDPIPFENAQGQLRALERWAEENRERFHPEETKETRFIQDVVAGMKQGAFTKQAQKHKMGVEEFADYVLSNPDFFTMTTRRRAQFLVNIRKKAKKQSGSGMCCCSRRNARGGLGLTRAEIYNGLVAIRDIASAISSTNKEVLDVVKEHISIPVFADILPPDDGEAFSRNFKRKNAFLKRIHESAAEQLGQEVADKEFPKPREFGSLTGIADTLGVVGRQRIDFPPR